MAPLVYLAGGMEFALDGMSWRQQALHFLKENNIPSWDPYSKEADHFADEVEPISLIIKSLNKDKDFNKLRSIMNQIVTLDLNTVMYEATCLLVRYDASVVRGAGTHAEMSIAAWANKPVHVWLDGIPINNVSSWAIGCMTSVSYTLEDAMQIIVRDVNEATY